MLFDAFFPKIFALITMLKDKLKNITEKFLLMEFDEKSFTFETELSNFVPIECIDFGVILKDKDSVMDDS